MKLIAPLALVLFIQAAQAQPDDYDRFHLWTGCDPVYLVVEGLNQSAIDIGLTVESLKTLVRSRLRSARIYSNTQKDNYLYLRVTVLGTSSGSAFSYELSFKKYLNDPIYSGLSGIASVWDKGAAGVAGGDAGYIRQGISEAVDEFIDEYLRVNAESCGGPQAPNN